MEITTDRTPRSRRRLSAPLVAISLLVGLAGCSSASGDEAAAPDDDVVVSGSDYGFDITGDVTVGAELGFVNASDREFHEMVLFRVADTEDRSLEELLELPEEEAMGSLTFLGVSGAAPGEAGRVVDGSFVISEPGRYVMTCCIPQGADPEEISETFFGADPAEGPPDFGDGTPHAMLGMVREITVDG